MDRLPSYFAGILSETELNAFTEKAADEGPDLPLVAKIVAGISAWIAAILLAVAAYLFSENFYFVSIPLLLAGALVLDRRVRGPVFISQAVLSLTFIAYILTILFLADKTDSPSAAAAAVIALSAGLYIPLRNPVFRFLAVLAAESALIALCLIHEKPDLVGSLLALTIVCAVFLWTREHRIVLGPAHPYFYPAAYALVFSMFLIPFLQAADKGGKTFSINMPPATVTALAAGLYLLFQFSSRYRRPVISPFNTAAAVLAAGLAAADYWAPGLSVSALAMILGFSAGSALLTLAGGVFIVVYLSLFYYNLGITLLAKSLILISAGILLLAAAFLLSRYRGRGEAQEEAPSDTARPRAALGGLFDFPGNGKFRGPVLLAGGLLVLVFLGASVVQKELHLRNGRPVLLRLAPVDPRSLIQGDYMELRYAAADAVPAEPGDGTAVFRLGADSVGEYSRIHRGESLAEGEVLIRYKVRGGRVLFGAESFFFQEGHAERYEKAMYGELVLSGSGGTILVGLRDGDR